MITPICVVRSFFWSSLIFYWYFVLYRVQSAMNSLPVRLFSSMAKVISHPWIKTVSQYSTSVVKNERNFINGLTDTYSRNLSKV
jgi:hypothetical protein